jgi:Do/DeqQ family serine protease
MDKRRFSIRAGLAVLAAALLISGAAWHSLAATSQSAAGQQSALVSQHSAGDQQPAAAAQTVTGRIPGGRDSYADIVKTVAPAVVTIRVEGKARVSPTQFQFDGDDFFRRFFGDDGEENSRGRRQRNIPRTFRQRGLGSGVVVTTDGYILTNNHVVDGADAIHIDLADGRTLEGKVIGTDKPSDLALVKVNATGLQTAQLGNSDNAQIGDVVLAIGNPLGVGQTVTMGIVSAKGRSTGSGEADGSRSYQDFLQTDAPINHGNSGGALVNTRGEVIGINAEMLSPVDANIGIGFAIPSNMARRVMDDLRKDGRVRRAQLGVEVQPVTSDLAQSLGLKHVGGAIISKVTPDSAADRAGLKRGDVIQSFNGQTVADFNSLRNHVADAQPGSNATVGIVRDGAEKTMSVKLDEAEVSRRAANSAEPASADKGALGIGVERGPKGLVITEVNPDSRAADAGLQEGDVIVEVNRQPVQSVDELRAAVRKTTDRPVLLLVEREGRDVFFTVKPAA